MDRKAKQRRVVELAKDVVIVALVCSALFLASRIQLLDELGGAPAGEEQQSGVVQTPEGSRADAARPLRLVANLTGAGSPVRYGVQYDTQQSDLLFQQVASLLAEALSSAGEPTQVSRQEWEQALANAPGVAFDFQGTIPLPVLVGWLSGENTALDGSVRRLVLTTYENQVAVYYRDEESQRYYRCLSAMANQLHLTEALGNLGENGAQYAFETESYPMLDPDTRISADTPVPVVYTAANPASGGQADLETILNELGFASSNGSFYTSVDGQVARIGSDTLRLYDQGVVEYQAGEEGAGFFQISARDEESFLFEAVEMCRQLTAATLGTRSGAARFYLSQVRQAEDGLEVSFNYCLNGSVVRLEGGEAAEFSIQNGQIASFRLVLRSYTDSGKTSVVMPVLQAAAAMEAQGLKGKELLLMYTDTGSDTVTAGWMAADSGQED